MKPLFTTLIIFHGLVHLAGFSKAFNLEAMNQITENISKANGTLWLVVASLFIITALLFLLNRDSWWMVSLCAIVLSQYLVFTSWHDAKWGTIANIIILAATVTGYGTSNFIKRYKNEVATYLDRSAFIPDALLTETDLGNLPLPVKQYLH